MIANALRFRNDWASHTHTHTFCCSVQPAAFGFMQDAGSCIQSGPFLQVPALATLADAYGILRGVWQWLYEICFFIGSCFLFMRFT